MNWITWWCRQEDIAETLEIWQFSLKLHGCSCNPEQKHHIYLSPKNRDFTENSRTKDTSTTDSNIPATPYAILVTSASTTERKLQLETSAQLLCTPESWLKCAAHQIVSCFQHSRHGKCTCASLCVTPFNGSLVFCHEHNHQNCCGHECPCDTASNHNVACTDWTCFNNR